MNLAWLGPYFFQLGSRNHQSTKELKSNGDGYACSMYINREIEKNINFLIKYKEDEISEISMKTSKFPKEKRCSNEERNMTSICKQCSGHNDSTYHSSPSHSETLLLEGQNNITNV